VRVIKCT